MTKYFHYERSSHNHDIYGGNYEMKSLGYKIWVKVLVSEM